MFGQSLADKRVRNFASAASIAIGFMGLVYWYRRPVAPWKDEDDGNSARSLIRQFLPEAEFAGEVTVTIDAPPEAIYSAIQSVTLDDMPLAKVLGQLRYLPAALSSQAPGPQLSQAKPFLEVLQVESSNIILAEEPPRELVVGAIGKFHNLSNQQFVGLRTPGEFIAFDQPGYEKLVMSFQIVPLADGSRCRLRLVHGTHALSDAARRYFILYWAGIKPGGNFVSWQMLRAIKDLAEKKTRPVGSM